MGFPAQCRCFVFFWLYPFPNFTGFLAFKFDCSVTWTNLRPAQGSISATLFLCIEEHLWQQDMKPKCYNFLNFRTGNHLFPRGCEAKEGNIQLWVVSEIFSYITRGKDEPGPWDQESRLLCRLFNLRHIEESAEGIRRSPPPTRSWLSSAAPRKPTQGLPPDPARFHVGTIKQVTVSTRSQPSLHTHWTQLLQRPTPQHRGSRSVANLTRSVISGIFHLHGRGRSLIVGNVQISRWTWRWSAKHSSDRGALRTYILWENILKIKNK